MKMELITYGLGKKFDAKKFEPIRNDNWVKPKGGLWASPVASEWGWADWCKSESYGDLTTHFKFWYEGNIFVINSTSDTAKMPFVNYHLRLYPDFEKMLSIGYDAIWLTIAGQNATRFGKPSLYGWDCESVLIMTPAGYRSR